MPLVAPSRKDTPGDNANAGTFEKPGTLVANVVQQKYFADVAAKVVLPMFKARNKPFVLVFWSRDPDGTQHNQGDSHLKIVCPASTGRPRSPPSRMPTTISRSCARRSTSSALPRPPILSSRPTTASRPSRKESKTSPAAQASYADVPAGLLPPGFVAIDLAKALGLPLYDPDDKNGAVAAGKYPKRGNGLIGSDPAKPDGRRRRQWRLRPRLCAGQGSPHSRPR